MQAAERIQQTGTDPLHARAAEPFVFRRNVFTSDFSGRIRSLTDQYDIGPFDLGGAATDVLYTHVPSGGVVIQLKQPAWESWLRDDQAFSQPRARSRTTIGDQLAEIHRLTGLTDGQLAATLPGGVARETVNRWRHGSDLNLRPENAYRIGLLLELGLRMEAAGIDARVWLHQDTLSAGATPYELLCKGRLGDVRQAVENVAAGAPPYVVADGHREHDTASDDKEDTEGWTWGERDSDGGA